MSTALTNTVAMIKQQHGWCGMDGFLYVDQQKEVSIILDPATKRQ